MVNIGSTEWAVQHAACSKPSYGCLPAKPEAAVREMAQAAGRGVSGDLMVTER
jgi:hypothetical protein